MNAREARGRAIADMGNQIVRIDDLHHVVRSQSEQAKTYDVVQTESGLTCTCPDYQHRGTRCKHIHSVEIDAHIRQAVKNAVVLRQADPDRCKFCDSGNIIKKGKVSGNRQQFGCKDCGRRFRQNLGFERKQATPEQITLAIELVFSGTSSRKTATALKMTGADATYKTVQRWASEYADLMDWFMDRITPQVGEEWRVDEVYLHVNGSRKYLFDMLDSKTKFWLSKMVASHKGSDDVAPLFAKAMQLAGKVPSRLISDGASNFAHEHKKQYAAKNFLQKSSEHIRHIHMSGDTNNNQMESFNGNTVRLRECAVRGLKRDDSAILTGLRLYHNFVRPHLGLPDNQTPAEAAGIIIEGRNKWLTMIQAAAKAKAKATG